MINLVVAAEVSWAGSWFALEDEANGFELGANSFGQREITMKTRKVGEDRVDLKGALTLAAAPGNVTETIEVYVSANDQATFDARMQQVENLLTQLKFQLRRTIGNSRQTWDCFAAEQIQITTNQPFLVATTGLISAQVPRLPDVLLETV